MMTNERTGDQGGRSVAVDLENHRNGLLFMMPYKQDWSLAGWLGIISTYLVFSQNKITDTNFVIKTKPSFSRLEPVYDR